MTLATNATKLGAVILGGVAGTVVALVAANSLVTQGNLVFDTTLNTTPVVQLAGVDSSGNATLTTIETMTGSNVASNVAENFITSSIMSGAVTQVNGVDKAEIVSAPCTSTGGTDGVGGYYNTCNVPNPIRASGSLVWYRLSCSRTSTFLSIASMSGGYVKNGVSNATKTTGSAVFKLGLPGFNVNQTFGSGSAKMQVGSGGQIWNPAENIIFQTSKVIPNTAGTACRFEYQFNKQP